MLTRSNEIRGPRELHDNRTGWNAAMQFTSTGAQWFVWKARLFFFIIQLSYTVRILIFWLVDFVPRDTGLWRNNLLGRHYPGVNSIHHCQIHHGFGWLKVWRFLFAVYSIWIIKMLTHSLLVNYRGFTCTRSLTMNSKFSIPHEAASCGIEISFSLLVELVQVNPNNSLTECVNL